MHCMAAAAAATTCINSSGRTSSISSPQQHYQQQQRQQQQQLLHAHCRWTRIGVYDAVRATVPLDAVAETQELSSSAVAAAAEAAAVPTPLALRCPRRRQAQRSLRHGRRLYCPPSACAPSWTGDRCSAVGAARPLARPHARQPARPQAQCMRSNGLTLSKRSSRIIFRTAARGMRLAPSTDCTARGQPRLKGGRACVFQTASVRPRRPALPLLIPPCIISRPLGD